MTNPTESGQANIDENASSFNNSTIMLNKLPVIYVTNGDLDANVREKCLNPLLEGLSKLNLKVLTHDKDNEELSKSHIMLLLGEDENLLKKAWENGVVPVTMAFSSKIQDYNPNTEAGNSFVYQNLNQWEVFAAIVRALETFKFPYDWRFIVTSCKKSLR